MSVGDMTRRVIITFEADSTKATPVMDDLERKSKDFGESMVDAAKKATAGINDVFETVHKLSSEFENVKKIADFIWDGYKDGLQDARNATASFGVDLDKLKEASHGLVTENDLLAFSAKAMKSAYGNTQADMEMAEKAMLALERRGVSVAEATNAVTEALVSGKTRGLEPYGIVVDRHIKDLQAMGEANLTLAQKEELHSRALQSLATLSAEVVDGQDAQGEAMGRSVNKVRDAWDDMKKSIGSLVEAMGPLIAALMSVTARIIEATVHSGGNTTLGGLSGASFEFGDIMGGAAQKLAGGHDRFGEEAARQQKLFMTTRDELIEKQRAVAAALGVQAEDGKRSKKEIDDLADAQVALSTAQKKAAAELEKQVEALSQYNKRLQGVYDTTDKQLAALHGSAGYSGTRSGSGEQLSRGTDVAGTPTFGQVADTGDGIGTFGFADQGRVTNDVRQKQIADMTKGWQDNVAQYQKQDKTFLEKTFGKADDFDLYHKAFTALTGAVSSSLDAWINGSESAGQAFKKFIGTAVEGVATQMAVESLKEAAMAIGSLAAYDYKGAAQHGEAAAAYAAGAAIAAVAAKALGGNGSSVPSTSGGGSGGSGAPASAGAGTGSGGGSAGQGPIIVYGDNFSDGSPRSRQIQAKKMVDLALGSATGMQTRGR